MWTDTVHRALCSALKVCSHQPKDDDYPRWKRGQAPLCFGVDTSTSYNNESISTPVVIKQFLSKMNSTDVHGGLRKASNPAK